MNEDHIKHPPPGNSHLKPQRVAEQTEALFDHATEGIIITDLNGTITLVNPCALQQFGYTSDELIGSSVDLLVPMESRHGHLVHRHSFAKQPSNRPMGLDLDLDLFGQRKDGSRFPVEVSLSKYSTDEGMFIVAFIIDITERKRHQDNLEHLNAELEKKVQERTASLQSALQELERSREELSRSLETERTLNEMKTRFVSTASHEFRTPLSTILSSVSLIGKYTTTDDQDKREKHILRIKSAINNLTDILNDFLSVGRFEEGIITPNLVPCNIELLAEGVLRSIAMLATPGQELRLQFSGDREIVTDPTIFQNILNNLLSNAIKYSNEQARIGLDISVGAHTVQVSVTDNGLGIPDEDQPHIFERFFRSSNAVNIQGTGLGLHIVSKYVELLNGSITFASESGSGTTFLVTLPVPTPSSHEQTDSVDRG